MSIFFLLAQGGLQAVAHVMRKTIEEYANERTGMWSNVRTSLTFAILSLRARGEIADAIVLQRLNALTFWGQHHADDVCELSVETSKPGLLCVSSLLECTENAQHDWERQFPCIKAFAPKMTEARKVLVNMTWLFSRLNMNREQTWCCCGARNLRDVQKEIQSAPLQL